MSERIAISLNIAEPFKSDEWVAALASMSGDNMTYMRLHNTIAYLERDLNHLRAEVERIAEHADIDGASHIAKQLRMLIGEGS